MGGKQPGPAAFGLKQREFLAGRGQAGDQLPVRGHQGAVQQGQHPPRPDQAWIARHSRGHRALRRVATGGVGGGRRDDKGIAGDVGERVGAHHRGDVETRIDLNEGLFQIAATQPRQTMAPSQKRRSRDQRRADPQP